MSFFHNMLLKSIGIGFLILCIRWLLFHTSLIYMLKKLCKQIEDCFHEYQSFKVPQFDENLQENQLYRKIHTYINSLPSVEDSDCAKLVSGDNPNEILLRLEPNQIVPDMFLGSQVTWTKESSSTVGSNLVLKIRKQDRRRVLRSYLQHIKTASREIDAVRKELKLYYVENMENNQRWRSIRFEHPTTLETIAMDADLKNKIRSDLEMFLKSKQYYHRIGKAWRRSYLLYGPSGTGKSSFVAAMANHLKYDIYNIDFSKLRNDSDLRSLLLQTSNRSIVVVEDFDRFLLEKLTPNVLSFMDGLLSSCCGKERVMVYTVSDKERVDSVLLRPGRIDVHIHFPLCDFLSFKLLAESYLGVKEHKLFPQVEGIFGTGARLSQAEIGEIMIGNRNSPSRAIKSIIGALKMNMDGRGVGMIGLRGTETKLKKSVSDVTSVASSKEGVNSVKELRKVYDFLRMKTFRKFGRSSDETNKDTDTEK